MPLGSLYATIAVLSAFENFFPPFPSDAVIAFGAFLADRAHGSPFTVFFLGWFGNVSGACITYALGRRFGSKAFLRRLEKYAGPDAEQRIKQLHKRYGFGGLFVSRFLPGVRAIVPPFAGAMKLPAARGLLSVATASAVWFGFGAALVSAAVTAVTGRSAWVRTWPIEADGWFTPSSAAKVAAKSTGATRS